MKKLFLACVITASFVACNDTATTTETPKVDSPAVVTETPKTDTATVMTPKDTTGVKTDTATKKP